MEGITVQGDDMLEQLKHFLQTCGLPTADIQLDGSEFLMYRKENAIVASGGLEFYGDKGLLRSVAVSPTMRGVGKGHQVVTDLLQLAKSRSVRHVFLLTETAPAFFKRMGFSELSRAAAPVEIQGSTEFSSVCPVSAVLMVRDV